MHFSSKLGHSHNYGYEATESMQDKKNFLKKLGFPGNVCYNLFSF